MSFAASSVGWDPKAWESVSDEDVVARVRAGDTACYEILMRRYNARLYRVARSILGDETEAEDVMQEAYVRAYEHLAQFAGEAKFSTWLTKIAVYEALGRLRRRKQTVELETVEEMEPHNARGVTSETRDPEQQAYDRELRLVLERALDTLPPKYRSVFVLRMVEGFSSAETAECLNLGQETVKTRLHRARAFLRKELNPRSGIVAAQMFPFHLSRCDRVVAAVFQRIVAVQPR